MPPRTPHFSRRNFLLASSAAALAGCAADPSPPTDSSAAPTAGPGPLPPDAIIDIHQHTNYAGRTDDQLIAHQKNMGARLTILLPAGHPVDRPSTNAGKSNGLEAKIGPNEDAYRLVQQHPDKFLFFANEVPDADNARAEIEKYLKLGARGIGEQKFNIDVESPAFDVVAGLAQDYAVPVLMHFQFGRFNNGYDRFWRVLEKYPKVTFIGHAQTFWLNIDAAAEQKVLYPKTGVAAGGWTDKYLSTYPNFYADMSAGSGLNALLRDEEHARAFLKRHQDKILYGSDCNDVPGKPPICQGALTLIALRRLCASPAILQKILHDNATKMFRLG